MRRRITNWMNDDPWLMGVFEPILLLLFIAVIGALLRWLYRKNGYRGISGGASRPSTDGGKSGRIADAPPLPLMT